MERLASALATKHCHGYPDTHSSTMELFRSLLPKPHHNTCPSSFFEQDFQVLNSEDVAAAYPDLVLQTPPLDIVTPPQYQGRRRNNTEARADPSVAADPIPRPITTSNHTSEGKMLALPIPTVRPVDINERREAGCMGINPITLMGEGGLLLPGGWGDKKEFQRAMVWHKPLRQREMEAARCGDSGGMWPLQQQRRSDSKPVVVDWKELQLQYSQAILDGGICVDSAESASLPFVLQGRAGILPLEQDTAEGGGDDDDGDEWVDVAECDGDDEDGTDRKKESGHKREDSGYSSSRHDGSSTLKSAPTVRPVMPQRKTVRFDDETIEKQREESKAWKILTV